MFASIFIIDDNSVDCFIAGKILKLSYPSSRVSTYQNPLEALEQLQALAKEARESFPQLILLDINMPRLDGWAFLEHYQHLPADLIRQCRLFMLSSSSDKNDIEKASGYGFVNGYFCKPLTIEMVQKAGASQCTFTLI